MTLPVFRRATQRALARLGESALLRGSPTQSKVNVEHDVQMADREGNAYIAQFVAEFDAVDNPAAGDTLQMLGDDGVTVEATYLLEQRLDTDGYTVKHVLRKV